MSAESHSSPSLKQSQRRLLSEVPVGPIRQRLLESFNLMENVNRGWVAEVVVAHLLNGELVGSGYGSWDVQVGSVRVEVKAAGDVQSWAQRRVLMPSFSIRPAAGWIEQPDGTYRSDLVPQRRSDVYIFCHHRGTRPDAPSEWDFYVVPTTVLDEVCGDQKSIGLSALRSRLSAVGCSSEELPDTFADVVAQLVATRIGQDEHP